jgi:hypothetical protein
MIEKRGLGKQLNEDTLEQRAAEIRMRIRGILQSLLKDIWDKHATEQNAKTAFIGSVQEKIVALIPEASKFVEEAFKALDESMESQDPEKIIEGTSSTVIRLLAEHLTLAELEKRLRSGQEEKGHDQLSRALSCEIQGQQIILHVPVAFFEDPEQARLSILEGFGILAAKIRTDPKYKNMNEISATSELVKKNPGRLKKIGFTVLDDENGKPTDVAKISVEKFLQIFN